MAKPYIPYSGPIVTRAEAKAGGLLFYFTGKPCPKGHVSERRTKGAKCRTCGAYVSPDGKIRKPGQRITPHPGRVVDGRKLCSACGEIKAVSQFHKHNTKPNGFQARCIECAAAARRADPNEPARRKNYYEKNKDVILLRDREQNARHPEKKRARNRKRYEAKKDEILAYGSAYYWDHRDHFCEMRKQWAADNPEQQRATQASWRANNRQQASSYAVEHVSAKKRAAVSWGDKDKIAAVYGEALRLTKETGIKHNVDHIVPLISKNVCGLHWEGNLQVLTESENKSKANRYWPDMWEISPREANRNARQMALFLAA